MLRLRLPSTDYRLRLGLRLSYDYPRDCYYDNGFYHCWYYSSSYFHHVATTTSTTVVLVFLLRRLPPMHVQYL